jgi:hypothetical protein
MSKSKDPMPGILDDTHPGCFYKDYGIIQIAGSKRYMVVSGYEGQLKICNSVESAKKFIDRKVKRPS